MIKIKVIKLVRFVFNSYFINRDKFCVMFGLDARKMSVKKIALNVLFLANLRRLTFRLVGGDSYSYKSQIAAMFGLDARIALAIFGALSVITGAALYSALDKVETTVFINELKEIEKAWEAYYLDTHKNLPRGSSDSTSHLYYILATKNLKVNPSIKGWRGPYLSYDVQEGNKSLLHPKYGGIYLITLTDSTSWGDSKDWNPYGRCSGEGCSIWLTISGIPYSEDSMIKKMDEIFDNSDGATTGNFKWAYYVSGSTTYWEIFYKVGTM